MSWFDGVPMVLLFAGPIQNYPAANANSSAVQSLITGATGGFQQARIPASFMQAYKAPFIVEGKYNGIVTASTAATTMTVIVGLAAASNSTSGGTATTITTSQAVVINSVSANLGWSFNFHALFRTIGYGTTTVSSTILTSSRLLVNTSTATATATATIAESSPTTVTTIDASVDQWVYATVTFSTASATNSCQLQQTLLFGAS